MRTDMGVLIVLFVLQCNHKLGKRKSMHCGRRRWKELEPLVLGLGQRSALRPLIKDRLPVSRTEQVMPGGGLVFPEVGEDTDLGPCPTMIPEPEPQASRAVGMSVCPAQLGMVDPLGVCMPAEDAEPRRGTPTTLSQDGVGPPMD